MKRAFLLTAILSCSGLAAGCVERRFVITTDPPFAIVHDEKGNPVSASPADRQFTYYGKYRFTLVRDGYQTTVVEENVKPPWYEYFPFEFIAENVIPWTIVDKRTFHYQLQPVQLVPAEAVLQQGELRRAEGKTIGSPGVPLQPQPIIPTVP